MISIVIVNYNGVRWLHDCLAAVTREPDTEIIVVDNGSSDGSDSLVAREFPGVRLLRLPENLGFAAGNNRGAAQARGDVLAFLNNDTVPQPGWMDALRRPILEDASVGLTTARIVYVHDPRVTDSAGDGYLRAGGAFKRFHGRSDASIPSGEVFGACGAACMIRRDLFVALGGFDEDFFMVYEDVDLSYRARLLGYRCVYVADAVVRHAGSGTLGRMSDLAIVHGQRNLEWTYWKNTPWPLLLRSAPAHILYTLAAGVGYAAAGEGAAYVRGKWEALRGLPRMLRKRRAIQRRRAVSSGALWARMTPGWISVKRDEKRFDLTLR